MEWYRYIHVYWTMYVNSLGSLLLLLLLLQLPFACHESFHTLPPWTGVFASRNICLRGTRLRMWTHWADVNRACDPVRNIQLVQSAAKRLTPASISAEKKHGIPIELRTVWCGSKQWTHTHTSTTLYWIIKRSHTNISWQIHRNKLTRIAPCVNGCRLF